MEIPDPVFAGYGPKHLHNPGWDGIRVICSVSSCISDGASYEDGVPWWTINRAKFYNTVDDALAAAGPRKEAPIVVFAYWMYPIVFDKLGVPSAVNLSTFLLTDAPDFPEKPPSPPWHVIGFDSLGWDAETEPRYPLWACSPLSCNGYGSPTEPLGGTVGFRVNQYCLVDSLETAVEAAKTFQREQPEPGTYLIVRVEAPTPELEL